MADGILSEPLDVNAARHSRPTYPAVAAAMGVVVEHRATGVVGAILRFKPQQIVIRDRHGRDHTLEPRDGAFMIDGRPIALRQPAAPTVDQEVTLTASGSVDAGPTPARIARPSRIWVEGIHDAELIEKVWGDDLRIEGVVVEQLDGMDDLADRVARFGARPGRRLAVLLDHVVDGSKESRVAAQISHPDVLVIGHPYVDVWQAIKPSAAGIAAWPVVPMWTDWKTGIMEGLGHPGPAGLFWKQLLGTVSTYQDLEQPLVYAVESMIDFVTAA